MKVDAYSNFHKECVSVRSRESSDYGRVVAHKPKVHVADATFVVQPSGAQRARESGKKNVHAVVRGDWSEEEKVVNGAKVKYDPFGHGEFYEAETGRFVESADLVAVTWRAAYAEGLRFRRPKATV